MYLSTLKFKNEVNNLISKKDSMLPEEYIRELKLLRMKILISIKNDIFQAQVIDWAENIINN